MDKGALGWFGLVSSVLLAANVLISILSGHDLIFMLSVNWTWLNHLIYGVLALGTLVGAWNQWNSD